MLGNTMEEVGVKCPGTKSYEGVRLNFISITRRWVSHFQKKVLSNT